MVREAPGPAPRAVPPVVSDREVGWKPQAPQPPWAPSGRGLGPLNLPVALFVTEVHATLPMGTL